MFKLKYIHGENIFDKFREKRESLIIMLKNGDISKKEYIEETYYYIREQDIKPFKIVDNFNKAVFNYQYYNMMAKYSKLKAKEIQKFGKHFQQMKKHLEKVNYYYHKKNQTTLRALELRNFEDVEAYYIKVKSMHLKNKLFEIVFLEDAKVVFHSNSEWLARRLEEEGVFTCGKKHSIIESYVNERY
ncbi:MAG: DUF6648 family protein [Bacteriovoracia bacterium]